ncbi:cyclin-A1 isoform X1 [Takifugu rubripes]|uniref:G2/mitotic-specific cyclin-B2 n=1 Tax=Takifugu rubripes TaxID=31033 RepID=A0A674ME32_TAKRU|nr:cyclin-A1 isoform X1 [Takifugu rubripes]|eukprot:XP_011619938.1 PREDICTED: cyclin-A1-like [Takifugu rubripes]
MMDFSTNNQYDDSSKENVPPGPEAAGVQRSRRRPVLGLLSENEQRARSLGRATQFPKQSSASDRSHLKPRSGPSSSSFEVCVEESREVVLTASGQPLDSADPGGEFSTLENEEVRVLLDLISGSCPDASTLSDESLTSDDVLCVFEYAEDIHQHMRESEVSFRPRPGFLENHPEITGDMRATLVNWMVEVVREYKLRSETLHLSVNYVDRFLSQTTSVRRDKLQLVGTSALMIAAKYEEVDPPDLDEFVYTTDSTYSRRQLSRMEHFILNALRFRMAAPTIDQFLSLFMAIQSVCPLTQNLAMYLGELSLLDLDVTLRYPPSLLAAAAYSLASYTLSRLLWPEILRTFVGYSMADISPCITDLHQLYIRAEEHPHQAIREKYRSSRYSQVSSITPPSAPFTPNSASPAGTASAS